MRLSSLHAILGDWDGAEKYVRRALEQERPSDQMLGYATRILGRRGAGPEGYAALYRRVIDRHPGHVGAHVALANVEAARGDLGEAARLCERAVSLGGDQAAPLATAGAMLRDMDRLGAAGEAFRKAAALDPRSGVLRAELGLVEFLMGRSTEALALIDEAIGLEPRNPGLYGRKAQMLRKLGREAEAAAAEARAAELAAGGA
jgi:tetratricopeptide (TPR) repeat protein